MSQVYWDTLTRVSGTATDGVWRGTTRVSWISTGTVQISQVIVTDDDGDVTVVPVNDGPSVEVGGPGSTPWGYQVLTTPVRVVTGAETWRPSLRLVSRNGTPVAGARSVYDAPGLNDVPWWTYDAAYYAPSNPTPSTVYTATTSNTGGLVLPSYDVQEIHFASSLAGWRTGSLRYHTVAGSRPRLR